MPTLRQTWVLMLVFFIGSCGIMGLAIKNDILPFRLFSMVWFGVICLAIVCDAVWSLIRWVRSRRALADDRERIAR
jgi:hypothetical protein